MILNKLELDINQINELADAAPFMVQNSIPTMVVCPDLATQAIIEKANNAGKYSIIIQLGWDKQSKEGLEKFNGLDISSLNCDGFEILVKGKSENEIREEIIAMCDFIYSVVSPTSDIRFILNQEQLESIKQIPGNKYIIRNSIKTKCKQSESNRETYKQFVEDITKLGYLPKLAGNISSAKMINILSAHKYAVNMKQAKTIVREYKEFERLLLK